MLGDKQSSRVFYFNRFEQIRIFPSFIKMLTTLLPNLQSEKYAQLYG